MVAEKLVVRLGSNLVTNCSWRKCVGISEAIPIKVLVVKEWVKIMLFGEHDHEKHVGFKV
ncbi:hypothetical protein CR513_02527, partial [Mucuna pruriens]